MHSVLPACASATSSLVSCPVDSGYQCCYQVVTTLTPFMAFDLYNDLAHRDKAQKRLIVAFEWECYQP